MDIESRADIDQLMHHFYAKAMHDAEIGHFFTEAVRLDLEEHLPVIGDFWESMLLGSDVYRRRGRSPLLVHHQLHQKSPLQKQHFARWLQLFAESVDALFSGPRANFAKLRSEAVARRMLEHLATQR